MLCSNTTVLDSDFPLGSYEFLCGRAENWTKNGPRVTNLGLILRLLLGELEVQLYIKVVSYRLSFLMTPILWEFKLHNSNYVFINKEGSVLTA